MADRAWTPKLDPLVLAAAALGVALSCGESGKSGAPTGDGSAGAGGAMASGGSASGGGATAGKDASSGGGGVDAGQGGAPAGGQAGTSMASNAGAAGTAGGAGGAPVSGEPLVIYWVDVEGGAATVLLAPSGEVVVVDAGNPGQRDAERIAAVLQDELQADQIDHLIITHYHVDHVGGAAALAALVPVERYYDHGPTIQAGSTFDDYVALAGDQRETLGAGDTLTLGELVLTFVTGAGEVIEPPLPSALPNPSCPSNVTKNMDGGAENGQSLGFVARFGEFDFVDLGDLTWDVEQLLMCPTNRIGTVDLFQVSHHGLDYSNSPQLVHGLAPTVAVMNNGATKGGHPIVFDTLSTSPGLQDVWAVHEATNNDAEHNAEPDMIANPDGPDAAHFLKAVILPTGAYTITNGRNGVSRTYASR